MGRGEPINCTFSGKLLARRDEQGLWLWCKACKMEHLIVWENIGTDIHTSTFESRRKNIPVETTQQGVRDDAIPNRPRQTSGST